MKEGKSKNEAEPRASTVFVQKKNNPTTGRCFEEMSPISSFYDRFCGGLARIQELGTSIDLSGNEALFLIVNTYDAESFYSRWNAV